MRRKTGILVFDRSGVDIFVMFSIGVNANLS